MLAAFLLAGALALPHPPSSTAPAAPSPWEADNPVVALPKPPLGVEADYAALAFAVTPERVRLGRWLFFDKRLSRDATLSCASCHRSANAFSEPTPHATGVGGKTGSRKSPSFVNGAWPLTPAFFWDGRAPSLVEQAKGPIANPIEMANTLPNAVKTLAQVGGYRAAFQQAFGDEAITIDRVAEALSAYEATRLSGNSPYDRFEAGDAGALSPQARAGRELFLGKARCAECHVTGAQFADGKFHNLGIGWDRKRARSAGGKPSRDGFSDLGRYLVTQQITDVGAFKTPGLRDVSRRAPYTHLGSLATLKEVVEHYNRGGTPNPWLDKGIQPLGLTPAEVDEVVAFLLSLDGEGYADDGPRSFPL